MIFPLHIRIRQATAKSAAVIGSRLGKFERKKFGKKKFRKKNRYLYFTLGKQKRGAVPSSAGACRRRVKETVQIWHDMEDSEVNPVNELYQWCNEEQHNGYRLIAHNFKGLVYSLFPLDYHNSLSYDGKFVLEHLMEIESAVPNEVTMVGQKIFSLRVGRTIAVDSYNFLSMPLAAFSSTFGITEVKKGIFHFATHRTLLFDRPLSIRFQLS